jgi:hypothetical protein
MVFLLSLLLYCCLVFDLNFPSNHKSLAYDAARMVKKLSRENLITGEVSDSQIRAHPLVQAAVRSELSRRIEYGIEAILSFLTGLIVQMRRSGEERDDLLPEIRWLLFHSDAESDADEQDTTTRLEQVWTKAKPLLEQRQKELLVRTRGTGILSFVMDAEAVFRAKLREVVHDYSMKLEPNFKAMTLPELEVQPQDSQEDMKTKFELGQVSIRRLRVKISSRILTRY